MKRISSLILVIFLFCSSIISQDIHHNPWDLIIYRPENTSEINEVRCTVEIKDENGNDVTKSCIRRATYEWVSNPRVQYYYKKRLYLSGGMAMHLNIKPGKYYITIKSSPKDYEFVEYDFENKGEWISNSLYYNTNNPAKVIFVYPTANDNGFYNGGWVIDYFAPEYYKFTKPKMEK